MNKISDKKFRKYNELIESGMRRAHVERSRAFYDLWQQMSTRFNSRKRLSQG